MTRRGERERARKTVTLKKRSRARKIVLRIENGCKKCQMMTRKGTKCREMRGGEYKIKVRCDDNVFSFVLFANSGKLITQSSKAVLPLSKLVVNSRIFKHPVHTKNTLKALHTAEKDSYRILRTDSEVFFFRGGWPRTHSTVDL